MSIKAKNITAKAFNPNSILVNFDAYTMADDLIVTNLGVGVAPNATHDQIDNLIKSSLNFLEQGMNANGTTADNLTSHYSGVTIEN